MANKIIRFCGNPDEIDRDDLIRKILDDLDDEKLAELYEDVLSPLFPEEQWFVPEITPWPYPEIVPWPCPEIVPWPYPEMPWPDIYPIPNKKQHYFGEPYQLPSDYEIPKTEEEANELSRRIREAIERSKNAEKQEEQGNGKVYSK